MTQQEKLKVLKELRNQADAARADADRNLADLTKQIAFQQTLINYAIAVKAFSVSMIKSLDNDIAAVTEGKL